MGDQKRILLIGTASYDIQSVANELAGRDLFTTRTTSTQFSDIPVSRSLDENINLKLTVAPGFMDHRADTSPKEMKKQIQSYLQSEKCASGFHAVVVALSYPLRWTDEERNSIQFTKDVLKGIDLSKCGTLVLTNGQNFKKKYPGDTQSRFQEYIHDQCSQVLELNKFLQLFGNRIMILDTELQDHTLNDPQIKQFFSSIAFDVSKMETEDENLCTWMQQQCCSIS